MPSDIGLIGLAVMGANLARNIADKGFKIVVYNRTYEKTREFIEKHRNDNLSGAENLKDFIKNLKKPRNIIILVKAGSAVDQVIEELIPLLEPGDTIIECGNSLFHDTVRRQNYLKEIGLNLIGCGVSGGEEGALKGPSLMPGGDREVYQGLAPIFEAIAAKDFDGNPCVAYIGEGGSGHFVKMVHNGIEYAIMQLMAEAYDSLRKIYALNAAEIADIFATYNHGPKLQSFLCEIAIPVLRKKDELAEGYLIDQIKDTAGQKGTGNWTVIEALNRGVALPAISEAVFARVISSQKIRREKLSAHFSSDKKSAPKNIELKKYIVLLENALYCGIITAYAQGFDLIVEAKNNQKWSINLPEIARIWEGGCIIRAALLHKIRSGLKKNTSEDIHLFEISEITADLQAATEDLRKIVCELCSHAIPAAAFSSILSYIDSYSEKNLPASFIQGLRDYFGAHSYERRDREGTFHTIWEEKS